MHIAYGHPILVIELYLDLFLVLLEDLILEEKIITKVYLFKFIVSSLVLNKRENVFSFFMCLRTRKMLSFGVFDRCESL